MAFGLGFGIGFCRRFGAVASDPGTIEGTPVSIVQGEEGETLFDVVTWGSMVATVGTLDAPVREMRLNSGSWATYVSTTALVHPDVWDVRESWTSSSGATRTDTAGPMTVVGTPVAAYPVLRDSQDTTISTAAASLPVTMPSGRVSGDTLVVEARVDGNTTITATGTWTVIRNVGIGSTYRSLLLRKISDADDTLVLSSSGGETLSAKTLCYVGDVTVTDGTTTTLNNSDVAELDLTTSAPTLWVASLSFDGASGPSASPPTGYTALGSLVQSGTATNHVGVLFATKESDAQTEDPGDWGSLVNVLNRSATLIGLRNA